MKILLPVDGSAFTRHMLAYLAAHDEWLVQGHALTVLHVASAVPPRAAKVLDTDTLRAYYQEQSDKVFKPVRAFFRQAGVEATFQARIGPPGETIAALAAKGKFGLVVMGSHGHGSLGNLVMGSVANKVLAQCKVPVLLVR